MTIMFVSSNFGVFQYRSQSPFKHSPIILPHTYTVDSKQLEHGCRMVYAGFPSFFGLGLEEGHVPTLWPLL